MKKICILLIVLVVCLSSCNNNHSSIEDNLKQIYVVDRGTYQDTKQNVNFVSDEMEYSVRDDVEPKKNIQILSAEFDAVYTETVYYPIGDKEVHKYTADEGSILLREDGSVCSVLGITIGTIDISPTDSYEAVQAKLEPTISKYVDISEYEYLEVQPWGSTDNESNFGRYIFVYYNAIQGYQTDWASVLVNDDGTISRLVIQDVGREIAGIDINKTTEDDLITAELSLLYDTDATQYVSYESSQRPEMVLYNDELNVKYTVSTNFKYNDDESVFTTIDEILIPLRLLSASE